jgi:hypothetical protein
VTEYRHGKPATLGALVEAWSHYHHDLTEAKCDPRYRVSKRAFRTISKRFAEV